MSLTMMALRIAAVHALRSANTIVGKNVLDSEIGAIDLTNDGKLSTNKQRLFIAVYTDTAKAKNLEGSGLRVNGIVDLIFNSGVSQTMTQTNLEDGSDEVIEGIPATDANFEALLDIISTQITRALVDPNNVWAQIFGDFVLDYVAKEQLRSSSDLSSVRIACAQLRLTVKILADPMDATVLQAGGVWSRFMALMKAQEIPQYPLFEKMLGESKAGLYDEYEKLTAITTRDAVTMQLYSDPRFVKAKFSALSLVEKNK